MDPLNVVARSHDLALSGRVVGYSPDDLSALLYEDREFFDYGGNLRVYPMSELPFWRVTMRRKAQETRRADFAQKNRALLSELRAELQARGPLGNRDFTKRSRVVSYRGGKDSAVGLYHLWLTGEVMVHHRVGFERVYDLRERVVPASADRLATAEEADDFFARKAAAYLGWSNARSWARAMSFFSGRTIAPAEARRRLDELVTSREVLEIAIEGEKRPCFLPATDADSLAAVQDGRVPDEWRPLAATTLEEAVFLAPLDTVIARGRAQALFDFEYLWEVYKPAAQRRWGLLHAADPVRRPAGRPTRPQARARRRDPGRQGVLAGRPGSRTRRRLRRRDGPRLGTPGGVREGSSRGRRGDRASAPAATHRGTSDPAGPRPVLIAPSLRVGNDPRPRP